MKQDATQLTLTFHWGYILLPGLILLVSIMLTVYFYHRLPLEVAYHFQADGSPDRWLNRGVIILWLLLPQLFLTLLAGAVTWGITKLGALFRQPKSTGIRPTRIIFLMGNMVALPQIILGFAMLDIFSYNAYQTHLMPLWVFTLIIMGVGGIILGIFFVRTMWQVWGTTK